MQDDKKEILKNNLIALQNEVNHQPNWGVMGLANSAVAGRSEEHTSELQSH